MNGGAPSNKVVERSDLLLEDNKGWTPLHEAAAAGMLDAVPRGIIHSQDLAKQWRLPFGPGGSVQATADAPAAVNRRGVSWLTVGRLTLPYCTLSRPIRNLA